LSLLALAVSSSAQPSAIPPCREEQVEVSVTNAGVGMSHWAEGIEFLNASGEACSLRGVPRLIFSGENGARLPAAICPNCEDYLFPARPITTVILKSGELAHILVGSSTAYDSKLCGRANAIQIFLPGESHPLYAREHELYYCVKIDVSAFLPGSTRNDPRWNGRREVPPPPVWGPSSRGVQLSLTPFTHWQRLGVLGFERDRALEMADRSTGDVFRPRVVNNHGETVSLDNVVVVPGPAASRTMLKRLRSSVKALRYS